MSIGPTDAPSTRPSAAAASALVDAIGPGKAAAVPANVADTASRLRLRDRVEALHGRFAIMVDGDMAF